MRVKGGHVSTLLSLEGRRRRLKKRKREEERERGRRSERRDKIRERRRTKPLYPDPFAPSLTRRSTSVELYGLSYNCAHQNVST